MCVYSIKYIKIYIYRNNSPLYIYNICKSTENFYRDVHLSDAHRRKTINVRRVNPRQKCQKRLAQDDKNWASGDGRKVSLMAMNMASFIRQLDECFKFDVPKRRVSESVSCKSFLGQQ